MSKRRALADRRPARNDRPSAASSDAKRRSSRDDGKGRDDFPIVGIGMSAGGLEAIVSLLNAMPADSGMALVIVQHLDPTRKSMLVELLGRQTTMPVVEIEDGMRARPDRVHVIIPAKTLTIEGGVFRLSSPLEPRGQRHPIDHFFTSLAADRRERAIAIVLTGAGSNGTAGLLDIKQGGGLCIVQDPESAKFDSMPRHAIAAGAPDIVLTPEKMQEALLNYVRHPYAKRAPPQPAAPGSAAGLDDVLAVLRARLGLDLRQYRRATLTRRLHRRMSLAQLENVGDYLRLVRDDAAELAALGKDLMINVTAFFRDPEAWEALDRIALGPIVDGATREQTIRVWVTACSTGHEAYSIAILLAERIDAADRDLRVKIFATDPADHNLVFARKGVYPASMVERLSPERIKRFFEKDGDSYRVKPDLRETVLFAPQNLLSDPPYSRIDLVSCRNLLIYLEPQAQDRVIALAHFALKEGGYLFLGNAETIGRRERMFSAVSKRWRIFRRIGGTRSSAADLVGWPAREAPARQQETSAKLADVAVKSIAERFGPASVVIDHDYAVHHFHGVTSEFLSQPAGVPTVALLDLARGSLRVPIRRAVQQAIAGNAAVTVLSPADRHTQPVAVTAAPIAAQPGADGLLLVSFTRPQLPSPRRAADGRGRVEGRATRDRAGALEELRDELRRTIEQYEVTNEEMQAANEESISVNEELQATNEELESSKEELQSLNEELNAVNAELEGKVTEIEQFNDDLHNLLAGNDIATIFLDRSMRIKWFTPSVRGLFDLIDSDVGRPISHFTQKFAEAGLVEKAEAAVARLETSSIEVRTNDRKFLQLRVQPYRTHGDRIAGAVVNFIDVTDLTLAKLAIDAERNFAQEIVSTVASPLLVLSRDYRVISANPAYYRTFRTQAAETEGRPLFELGAGEWNLPALKSLVDAVWQQQENVDSISIDGVFPRIGERSMLVTARRIAGDDDREDLTLVAIEDDTLRRRVERHQELLVAELSHRVKNTLAVVKSMADKSLRSSTTLQDFAPSFLGRVDALARAHDLAIAGGDTLISLARVCSAAMVPFSTSGQIEIGIGPAVDIDAARSRSLILILHELATNAVKYGALSTSAGRVAINWQSQKDAVEPVIVLAWVERGGPPVAAPPPRHRGQGTGFVERSAAYDLNGRTTFDFRAEGLVVRIAFPLWLDAPDASLRVSGEPLR